MNHLKMNLGKIRMNSPLMTASGTWGHSDELEILNKSDRSHILRSLGAFVTKGVTFDPRQGNRELRIVETQRGLLNSIGLQNEGVIEFVRNELPLLLKYKLPIIVNISAESIEQFGELADYIDKNNNSKLIEGIEINVSCPNIESGGLAFGVDPDCVKEIVAVVKRYIDKNMTIITKLTPNISDIVPVAQAAIEGGTDVLSMINTIRGMAIDIRSRKPFLGNKIGGLSGPAIKPVGVLMVYECFERIPECKNKQIPIVGIGGISSWQDALEYIMAGATAIGVGTAWLVSPLAVTRIHQGLKKYLKENNLQFDNLIGIAHDDKSN